MKTGKRGFVGLGLDAQHRDRYPGGLEDLCSAFAPVLSHLSIVNLGSVKEALSFKNRCAGSLPVIHHLSGVAPADPKGPDLQRLRALNRISDALDAVWCCEDVGLWSLGPYDIPYFTPPLLTRESLDHTVKAARLVDRTAAVPFLPEVPSCSFVVGDLSLGAFFAELTERASLSMVLDVSHVFSYAILSGQAPSEVLSSFPLSSVQEIHIAGGRIDPRCSWRYIDSHSNNIMEEVLGLLESAVPKCANLQCVTYEIGVGLTRESIASALDAIGAVLANAKFSAFRGACVTARGTSSY